MTPFSKQARFVLLPIGIVVGVGLAFGLTSLAEDSELDSEPRVFPYNGVLELDGAGFTGQADFQFSLTDEGDCDFTEAHDAVTVSGGRFSVNIGGIDPDSNTLPNCVFDAERMFIQIAVRESGDNQPHRALSGRQRIHPVPFAYWAAEGSDFRIDGNANVGGTLNSGGLNVNGGAVVGGNLVVGNNAEVGSRLHLTSSVDVSLDQSGALEVGPTNGGNITMDGNEIQARNNGVASPLTLQNEGGETRIRSGASVTGNISVSGDVIVSDDVFVTDDMNLNGFLANNQGNVTISDSVDVTEDLDVADDLTVGGSVTADIVITSELRASNLQVGGLNSVTAPRNEDFNDVATANLGLSSSTHFCALTRIRVGDDDGEDDTTECLVTTSNGIWQVRSRTNSNETEVICGVRCFRFR